MLADLPVLPIIVMKAQLYIAKQKWPQYNTNFG
jgi:hypothetical protein